MPIRLRLGASEGLYRIRPFEVVVRAHRPERPDEFFDVIELWRQDSAEFGSRGRIDTTMGVGMAAAAWTPLRSLLEAEIPDRLELSDDQVLKLLDGAADRLESSGVVLEWDPGLSQGLSGKVVVGSSGRLSRSVPEVFDQDALQGFSWQLALDGQPLSEAERILVAEADGPVARLRERWVLVPRLMAERARNPDLKPLTAIDALSVALTGSTVIDG